MGVFVDSFTAKIPPHGVTLIKIYEMPIEDSAIGQVNANHLSVSVSAGVLQINNLTGNNVISIYTLLGQLVSTVITGSDTFNRTLNRGNYILTVRGENNHSQVIVVK